MWRRPVLGALRRHGGVAAATSLVLSVVAVLPSRRGYFTREHRSAITLQDGRGSYAATLSWQWSTGQPRHLVLRVQPPDSTSSVARDSFESIGEEPSGTNSAAPQATGRDASDYVFGRLFLRPYNVAELLCVLEGRTAFAKITREHAALTLTPMESKTNNTTRSVATSPSQLPALSCFMLSGHFTIKAPVASSASNDTQENLDKDGADDDDGGDATSPQETQYTYVTSDTRDMRLVLRDAELMFVKSHLENILSDFFGLEHRFHFEIAHEALQRQRARLEASYRRRAQGGGNIGGGAVSGSAFSGRDRAAPVRYRSQQAYSSPRRPSAATTMRGADTTITNTVSHVPTAADAEEHAPRMTATAATTQAQTVAASAAAAAALRDAAATRATDKATTLREFSVDDKDIEEEEDIAEEEDEEVIEEEEDGAEEEEDVVAEMVQERDEAADALAASVATPLTAATASPIRASAQPAPPTTTQESELSADVDDVAEEFIEDEAEELAEVEEEDGEGVFEEPQTGSTASPLPTATTMTTTTAHTASGVAAQTGANTTTTAVKVVSGVTQPATASTSATQDATVELEEEDEYIRARYHRADDVKQVVIESVEKEGGFDVVRKTELKEQPIAQPGAVIDTVVSSGAFRSKDGQVTGSFQYVAQQQQPTPTTPAAAAASNVAQVAQPIVGTPVMKPATAAPSFISRVVVPTHPAKASSSTKKTAKTKRGGGGKRGKKAARSKK